LVLFAKNVEIEGLKENQMIKRMIEKDLESQQDACETYTKICIEEDVPDGIWFWGLGVEDEQLVLREYHWSKIFNPDMKIPDCDGAPAYFTNEGELIIDVETLTEEQEKEVFEAEKWNEKQPSALAFSCPIEKIHPNDIPFLFDCMFQCNEESISEEEAQAALQVNYRGLVEISEDAEPNEGMPKDKKLFHLMEEEVNG
jgi:hypothetical protein